MRDHPLAQDLGEAQTRAIHEALKPHLRSVGVGLVEERIGRPRRFFENVRHRGTFRLTDFLATCAALDLDPVELAKDALSGRKAPSVRPPRIVTAAWSRLRDERPGLGAERMADLEAAVQAAPVKTRPVLTRELSNASRRELPRLLGLYASSFRVESDLPRAELVLRQALEIAREIDFREAEPDLLIRLAYVALEREQLHQALRWAQEGTLGFARLGNYEGQGRGFQTIGMLRYYAGDHRGAIHEAEAGLVYLQRPLQRLVSHQLAGTCFAALGDGAKALAELSTARDLATDAPSWILGKLTWLESRLKHGHQRLDLLRKAKEELVCSRPTDSALATLELIELALSQGQHEMAEQETLGLCALMERNPSPRIEMAIVRLFRHQGTLSRQLLADIRRSLDRGRSLKLAALIEVDAPKESGSPTSNK